MYFLLNKYCLFESPKNSILIVLFSSNSVFYIYIYIYEFSVQECIDPNILLHSYVECERLKPH